MWVKKLLIAVDFTPPSHEALRTGAAIAADNGAEVVLAYILQPTMVGSPELPISFDDNSLRAAEADLEKWKQDAERIGVKQVSTKLVTGTPWHEIVEILKHDPGFDLVVVGTHGRTGLKHVLLGSVAERVVRHAPCAVLVVRARD